MEQSLNREASNNGSKSKLKWFILGSILLLVLLLRLAKLDVPLERDEGEFAYMGQLLLQGDAPFSSSFNMKLPGTNFWYAIIMSIFGQTSIGIHLGLTLIILLSTLFLFQLVRQTIGIQAAYMAALTFGVVGLDPYLNGFAAHSTHFINLWVLAAALSLLKALKGENYLWYLMCGLFLGLAFITKQHAVFFGPAVVLFLYFYAKKQADFNWMKRSFHVFLGYIIPYLIVLVWVSLAGSFDTFWFWTVDYASSYIGHYELSKVFGDLGTQLFSISINFLPFWVVAIGGLIISYIQKEGHDFNWLFISFFLAAALAVSPGAYFSNHYFLMLLPAASIFFGLAVQTLWRKYEVFNIRLLTMAIVALPFIWGFLAQKDYFFSNDPLLVSRKVYGNMPFAESKAIAEFIKENSDEDDKVFVMGSEPQIFFYSKRKSATGFVYLYSIIEDQPQSLIMEKQLIKEVEESSPEILVGVNINGSWIQARAGIRPNAEVFDWFANYQKGDYELIGLLDQFPGYADKDSMARMFFGEDVIGRRPESADFITIFKKK